jgi:threonine dehydratase
MDDRSQPAAPPDATALPITFDDVRRAAAGLDGVAHRTPVLRSRALDAAVGAEVFLKAELFQRGGAFKFRGAWTKIAALRAQGPVAGVVAFSSGNHAGAVALAASLAGLPAVVVMPDQAPPLKRAAAEGYGARVVGYDLRTGDREAIAAAVGAETGYALVPPFDDPAVMAGQGTAALELVDEVGPLDVMVVPVGGGGLVAGTAVAVHGAAASTSTGAGPRARGPAAPGPGICRVVGVEPATGDDAARSLAAGRRITLDAIPETIADGQQVRVVGQAPFAIMQRLVDAVVTVTDAEIVAAMVFLFERSKVVVEPSGATGVAALLTGRVGGVTGVSGQRIGVILSGGNVDAARFAALVAGR